MDKVGEKNYIPGGSAAYASLLAHKLGCKVSIKTSYGPDFPFVSIFDDIEIGNSGSERTTIFCNDYNHEVRRQFLLQEAEKIQVDSDLLDFNEFDIVHFCPIADEFSARLISMVSSKVFKLVTPQGWLRKKNQDMSISSKSMDWSMLAHADIVVMSREDLEDQNIFQQLVTSRVKCLAVTMGNDGVRVYSKKNIKHYPAIPSKPVDTTGAGDIFATALALAYYTSGNLDKSVEYAQKLASDSVRYRGLDFITHLDTFRYE